MIVHVVPCGLSILRNLGRDARMSGLKSWAVKEKIHERQAMDWAHFRQEAGGWLAASVAGWDPADLSAECASLAKEPKAHDWEPPDLPPADDPVVFFASDTALGVLAALINAVFLGRPIRFHESPFRDVEQVGDAIQGGEGEPVYIIRIPGLEPVRTDTFVPAMINLGAALHWSMRWKETTALVVNVAGGYKATIPYIIVFSEYMNRLTANVRVFCLHEGDGTRKRPDPIEIFLRRPELRDDRAELEAARLSKNDAHPAPLPSRHLEGFAYRRLGGGGLKLTEVGEVLSDFFTLLPPG